MSDAPGIAITEEIKTPFGVISVDSPWKYKNFGAQKHGAARGHYAGMTFDQMSAIPVERWSDSNATMAHWATWPKLIEAVALLSSWGYTYATAIPWIKTSSAGKSPIFGVGRWHESRSRAFLVGVREGKGKSGKVTRAKGDPVRGLLVGDGPILYHPDMKKPEGLRDWLLRLFPGWRAESHTERWMRPLERRDGKDGLILHCHLDHPDFGALKADDIPDARAVLILETPWDALPRALVAMAQKGFEYRTGMPWVDWYPPAEMIYCGIGFWTQSASEILIIGERGKGARKDRKRLLPTGDEVQFYAPRAQHSRKPEEVQDWIDRAFRGPKLELFATRAREGWTTWGLGLGYEVGPFGVRRLAPPERPFGAHGQGGAA